MIMVIVMMMITVITIIATILHSQIHVLSATCSICLPSSDMQLTCVFPMLDTRTRDSQVLSA